MGIRVLAAVATLLLSALTFGDIQPSKVDAFWSCYHDGFCVHEAMAAHAADLYPDFDFDGQFGQVDYGAGHEDEVDLVWDHGGACTTITHFWDVDKGPTDPVDPTAGVCSGGNAWWKAQILWDRALGEYHDGDLSAAYFYLGHVIHLLGDMAVPAHAHEDMHPFADAYEDWFTTEHTGLTPEEYDSLVFELGPLEIPDGLPKLYWLFYTTAQVGDFYASDQDNGDSLDPEGWAPLSSLDDDAECRSEDGFELGDCNLNIVRRNTYLYAIRAVASLYQLFEQETRQQTDLTVVIDSVNELECHDDFGTECESGPDYFMRVGIGGFWSRNEGEQVLNTTNINPGWAFGHNVGLTGSIPVEIELWDEDEDPNPDDPSDIYTDSEGEERRLWLTVNLDACIAGDAGAISGDVTGACGTQLTSAGDDSDRSQIWFRILAPNVPPEAHAGVDQTVNENAVVTLNGSYTDPNVDDTHTFLWHLDSSSGDNCVSVPDATTQTVTFTVIDDCIYDFTFTVTDNHGAQGSDSVVVTAVNVAPVASIDSITDELGAEIGGDVPVALVGLDVHLAGSFTDVGIVDTHTASLNWGDGYTQTEFDSFSDCLGWATGGVTATHAYGVPGTYTITLTVTDDDLGVATAMAQIEVADASGAIEAVVESLTPLAGDANIQSAIDKLQGENGGDAADGALDMLEQGNANAALEKIKQALAYLEAAESEDPNLDLTYDKGLLALAAKSVAVGAIAEAKAGASKPNDLLKIQQAESWVAAGDTLLAAHDYVDAVDDYQRAVRGVLVLIIG